MNLPLSVMLAEIEAAAALVHQIMPPTPQHYWPLLSRRAGRQVFVKHENHGPTGCFQLRGALVYLARLQAAHDPTAGVVTASTGNHGQAVALAARLTDLPATVVVPEGTPDNACAAIEAWGAALVVAGEDFQDAREHAADLAAERSLHFIAPFHPLLVQGAATYTLELLRALPDLDTLYVPLGMGTGVCGAIAARDALGAKTKIVGVVAEGAPAYADSFWARYVISTPTAHTVARGLAVRAPDPVAVGIIGDGADRVVAVSDAQIEQAMGFYVSDTHNLAEAAGAAALAALVVDAEAGDKVALVLSGGNAG